MYIFISTKKILMKFFKNIILRIVKFFFFVTQVKGFLLSAIPQTILKLLT